MRIVYPAGARNDLYDRNGASKGAGFAANAVASHADTQRWSYTAPASRKLLVGSLSTTINPQNAGGPANLAQCYGRLTPSGGAATTCCGLALTLGGGVIATSASHLQGMILMPNDQLEGRTVDLSTGASASYFIAFAGLEFDA